MRARKLLALALVGVAAACGGDTPSIDTLALPGARVGQAYEARLEASGPPEIAWSLAEGRLPAGLALSKAGRILGTPEEAGRFELVIEAAVEGGGADRKPLVLQVGEGRPLTLHTTRLPEAVVGIPYGAKLDATGGVAPYRWSVSSGALPDGLAFAAESDRARLVGKPRVAGSFAFALEVRDDRGGSVTRQVTLRVNERRTPIRVVTETLPPGRRAEPYRAEILSAGGAGETLAWDVVDGELPPGLTLRAAGTPATTVTGTPTRAGAYRFTVSVVEASGGMASKSLDLVVGSDPIRFGGVDLPVAEVGQTYTSTLALAGGTGKGTTLSLESGKLPRGVLLAEDRLAGVPKEPGRYPIVVRATDDSSSATVAVELEVLDVLRISRVPLPPAQVGVAFTTSIAVEGAAGGAEELEVEGLPAGLEATEEDGGLVIRGTPTAPGRATLTVSAEDARGRAALEELELRVLPRLRIATRALPSARVGEPYEASLRAEGGQEVERRWSVVKGRLPYGVALDAKRGLLVGTATTAGREVISIRVQGVGTATRAFALEVVGAAARTEAPATDGPPDAGRSSPPDMGAATPPDAGRSRTPDMGRAPDMGAATPPDAGRSRTPDAGRSRTPDAGRSRTPDAGRSRTPDAGRSRTPDAGRSRTSDAGRSRAPDAGSRTPDAGGSRAPDPGSRTPDAGRSRTSDAGSRTPDAGGSRTSDAGSRMPDAGGTPDAGASRATSEASPKSAETSTAP